jgi:predicted RNA-binding Zn ribbon-like protein
LDFANTLDWRTSKDPQELIPSFADFLAWCERRGTMSKSAIETLTSTARRSPAAAEATLAEAYSLRSEIWGVCETLRQHGKADLASVNALLAQAPPQPRLVGRDAPFVHDLAGDNLREPLWPLLWSLTAVLSSADAARIGCCQAEGCGWFYVDESPNRSRLWCSSELCGNRERARRAYAKRRSVRPRVVS